MLGDLVQTTDGRWITRPPSRCPNGHPLGRNQVLVGHVVACPGHGGGGHTSWHAERVMPLCTGHRSTFTAPRWKAQRQCESRPKGADGTGLSERSRCRLEAHLTLDVAPRRRAGTEARCCASHPVVGPRYPLPWSRTDSALQRFHLPPPEVSPVRVRCGGEPHQIEGWHHGSSR